MRRLFTLLFILVASINFSFAQDTLVAWTFSAGNETDSVATFAKPMNAASVLRSNGTSAINWTTNGVTGKCAQATDWNNGANAKYWEINFKSIGFMNLTLSSAQRSGGANPGPRDFKVQYKITSGGIWTDVSGLDINTGSGTWTPGTVTDFSLPAALNNLTDMIYLRWIMTTDSATDGNLVLATGISKIDDIFIKAVPDLSAINQNVSAENLLVYPNPATETVNINSVNPVSEIRLFDMHGMLVYSSFNEFTNATISLEGRSSGLYFLQFRVRGIDGVITKKLIVE